jgi:hypothetical protein
MTLRHLSCLSKTGRALRTADGHSVDVWELTVPADEALLSSWAKAFRQHYCLDAEIDALREGTGLSRAQYLTQLVFPDESRAPGPAIRSGDFAELLIADYVEHLLGYSVPRSKYADKGSRDESVKGVDILGFKIASISSATPADSLLAFEAKAQLTGNTYNGRLQAAIDASSMDSVRLGITLNATKRRLLHAGDRVQALVVQRFQNPTDNPYVYLSGAAAVLSDTAYDEASLQLSTAVEHINQQRLRLIVVRGSDLMSVVHAIYKKAADEA